MNHSLRIEDLVSYCQHCLLPLVLKEKNAHSECEKELNDFPNNNILIFNDLFLSECRDFRFNMDYWVFNSHKPRIYAYNDFDFLSDLGMDIRDYLKFIEKFHIIQ